jgi:hypothetical protein
VRAWRLFDHAPELASDEKIKGIAAFPINASPLNSTAKLLGTCHKVDRHILLARSHKDYDMKVVIKARQIDLLNVLKIDEQQFVTQFDLLVDIRMPNAQPGALRIYARLAVSSSLWLGGSLKNHKSSGVRPVRFPIRASIRGPISSLS